ncbi:MAG: hypothetical protein ACPGU5_02315 [Lishizhenia sp.]
MFLKILAVLAFSFSVYSQDADFEFTSDWKTFYSSDEILIEVKTTQAVIANRNQNLIVFKIENLTNEILKTSYKQHIFRKDFCHGCSSINGEYDYELVLEPNQIINGEDLLKENKALCVFNTFVNLVPGMSNIPVDRIEFVNMNTIKL